MTEKFFSPCPRGLEQTLADEITELGGLNVTAGDAGVEFAGDFAFCYRVNLMSRIASRVLWQIGKARYPGEDDIYKAALALPWDEWFEVGDTIAVSVALTNAR
jgi:putative N6-adenine-specific DNA methylase